MNKKLVCGVLAIVCVVGSCFTVYADQISTYKQQKSAVKSKIDNYKYKEAVEKEKLKQNKQKKEQITSEINDKVEAKTKLINDITSVEEMISSLDVAIDLAQKDYDNQHDVLEQRIRSLYVSSKTSYLEVLLSSKGIVDFFNRVEVLKVLADQDQKMIEEIKVAKTDIEYKKELKEREKELLVVKKDETEQSIGTLLASRSAVETEIKKNQSNIYSYEKEQDELLKVSGELTNLIKSLESTSEKYVGGKMLWPVPSSHVVSSAYGNRPHPISGVYKMHTGVDIGAPYNAYIVAANGGVVIYAGWQSGYGNTVIIDHGGGTTTLYAHIISRGILVKKGDRVKAGQNIAKVGSTGYSTGPHLHFEVRENGAHKNPINYVKP